MVVSPAQHLTGEYKKMRIITLTTNWFSWNDGHESGEDCTTFEVGKNGVTKITEHQPAVEGDKWFYDVEFENQEMRRLFNPDSVSFEEK